MKDIDGVLHDHTALDRHIMFFKEELTSWGDEALKALDALSDEMHAHMRDEQARLFARAEQVLGDGDTSVQQLREQHRNLEVLLDAVRNAPEDERAQAFEKFKSAFDQHSLSEADLFGKIWDEMFPGRMMGG